MNNNKIFKNLALISQIAISVITPILLCVWIGGKLDSFFKTEGLLSVIMIVIGAGAGFLNIFKLTGLYGREKKNENKEQ